MFKKIQIVILFIAFTGIVFGQDSVYVFKVSKPKNYINITPNDSVLIKGKRYLFNVWVSDGKSVISKIKADSLRVSRVDKTHFSVYVPKNIRTNKTTLQVYEKRENGNVVLAKLKKYDLEIAPKPVIFVGGVKADSLIDKKHLYEYSKLDARYEGWRIPVLSFELSTFSNGIEKKFVSENNKLTVAMKHYIQRLEPGKVLYFNNVKCLLPNGDTETVERIRLFFDETNQYKVGERILYNGN